MSMDYNEERERLKLEIKQGVEERRAFTARRAEIEIQMKSLKESSLQGVRLHGNRPLTSLPNEKIAPSEPLAGRANSDHTSMDTFEFELFNTSLDDQSATHSEIGADFAYPQTPATDARTGLTMDDTYAFNDEFEFLQHLDSAAVAELSTVGPSSLLDFLDISTPVETGSTDPSFHANTSSIADITLVNQQEIDVALADPDIMAMIDSFRM
jgi:hypothetical protein